MPPVPLLSLALLLAGGDALAVGSAVLSVPVAGGALCSPTRLGPTGLAMNPAAASALDRELWFDLGLVHSDLEVTLEGEEPDRSAGTQPIPSLGLVAPLGDHLGLGWIFYVPYGRSGGGGNPEGPERFHGIEGGITVLESDLALALTPEDFLSVGVAARVALVSLDTWRAVDTGQLIASVAGVDPEELVGDPFLEGQTRAEGGRDVALGWSVGAQVRPAEGWTVGAYFRSGLEATPVGTFTLVPSNDLLVVVDGELATPTAMPAEAGAAVEIPLGASTLRPELHWVGWSSYDVLLSQPRGLDVNSEDPVFDEVLDTFDLTLQDLLGGVDEVVTKNGTRNIWVPGLGVSAPASERITLHGGLWHHRASTPARYVHPSNLDFATTDLRGGVEVGVGRRTSLGLVGDLLFSKARTVTNSELSLLNDPDAGTAVPSGNGTYRLGLGRLGLSVEQGF